MVIFEPRAMNNKITIIIVSLLLTLCLIRTPLEAEQHGFHPARVKDIIDFSQHELAKMSYASEAIFAFLIDNEDFV